MAYVVDAHMRHPDNFNNCNETKYMYGIDLVFPAYINAGTFSNKSSKVDGQSEQSWIRLCFVSFLAATM